MGLFNRLFGRTQGQKPCTLKEYNNSQKSTPPGKDVAYIQWSCLNDEQSCPKCKAKDGICYLPSQIKTVGLPPLKECTCKEGCRCAGIYVYKSESGASKWVSHIKQMGGVITAEQANKFDKSLRAKQAEKQRQEWEIEERRKEIIKKRRENLPPPFPIKGDTCPYCKVKLNVIPKAKKKCASCGQYIHVRTRPGNNYRELMTDSESKKLDEFLLMPQ